MKFSVIIPVYNSEKTIGRCIESLLNQSYNDYEIIVVNDGSTDKSQSVINSYNSPHIRYYSKSNGGVSSARNYGLSVACGEIICFIDSDDYVADNYFSALAKSFVGADAVFFSYKRVEPNQSKTVYHVPSLSTDYYENLLRLTNADALGYTWVKAIKKSLIIGNKFNEHISLYEDELFTLAVLSNPCSISVIDEPLYNYVITSDSLSFRVYQDYCILCDTVYKLWKDVLPHNLHKHLVAKANHMTMVCQYYGMEKDVNPFLFYKQLSQCVFFNDCTSNNAFVSDVRSNKFIKLLIKTAIYRVKNKLYFRH